MKEKLKFKEKSKMATTECVTVELQYSIYNSNYFNITKDNMIECDSAIQQTVAPTE